MLIVDKHTNLKLSLFNVAAEIVEILHANDIATYRELSDKLQLRLGEDVKYLFTDSLIFLYSLGKILYHPKLDSFELIYEN